MRTAQSSRPAQEILVESLYCPILSHPTSTGYEALGAFKLGAAGYPSVPAFWATARTAAKSSTKICGIPSQCPHDVRWLHIDHSRSTARKSLVTLWNLWLTYIAQTYESKSRDHSQICWKWTFWRTRCQGESGYDRGAQSRSSGWKPCCYCLRNSLWFVALACRRDGMVTNALFFARSKHSGRNLGQSKLPEITSSLHIFTSSLSTKCIWEVHELKRPLPTLSPGSSKTMAWFTTPSARKCCSRLPCSWELSFCQDSCNWCKSSQVTRVSPQAEKASGLGLDLPLWAT